ncbi:phosphatidylinositol-3 [Entamoeba marina]
MFNIIKHKVSQDKYRFQDDKFDLDLTYITNRIIAMGFPSTGVEAYYRNDINDVSLFMNSRHPHHYMIFNLTESTYDAQPFNQRVKNYPFPDHHNPPLLFLFRIISEMYSFYSLHPDNVVVVHCLAGKGRTGTVIAAFLLYIKATQNTNDSLRLFAEKHKIVIGPLPDYKETDMIYILEISDIEDYYNPCVVVKSTDNCNTQKVVWGNNKTFSVEFYPSIPIAGDVNIRIRLNKINNPPSSHSIVGRVSFHTYFIPSNELHYEMLDIDIRKPFKNKVQHSFSFHIFYQSITPVSFPPSELTFLQQFYDTYTSIPTPTKSVNSTTKTIQRHAPPKRPPPPPPLQIHPPPTTTSNIFPPPNNNGNRPKKKIR